MTVDLTTVAVDPSVGGSEKILCADGTTPYHVTPDLLSAYAIDQIEAITPTVTITGSSAVYVLHGGVMSPVDIDYLTAYHLGIMWAKAAESAPDGADLVPLLDGSTQKTVTLTLLSELVRATIEATILDISDLADGSGAIATSDYMLVTQTTTGKRIQISDLSTLIYASLDSYVAALGAVTTTVDADVFYVIQGGVEKKCTAAELKTYIGASLDGSGTASTLAQWVDSDTLQAGPSVVLSATGFSGGSDVAIPTTLTVRGEMDMIIYDSTDIGAALVDADTILVDDGALGTTQRKSALSRVWTYIASKLATYAIDTLGAATDVTTLDASTTAHGLVVKATAPAAGLVNVVGIANAESAYTNKPLFDTTNPAALGSVGPGTQVIAARRDHIHANPAIDTLAAATDITTLNASTSAHGLVVKATAPASGLYNYVGITNGETAYTNKALFDATTPAAVGTGATGSAATAARRDHVHDALPYVAVDGTLPTGANADFTPTKLVYNKTCSDSDGNDVIDLEDGTIIGQMLTIYLGTKAGSDEAVITPVTGLGYTTITLGTVNFLATLQWQGATVGWAILYTTGTVA